MIEYDPYDDTPLADIDDDDEPDGCLSCLPWALALAVVWVSAIGAIVVTAP